MHSSDTSPHRLHPSAWLCRWPGARLGPVLASLGVLGLVLWATAGLAQARDTIVTDPGHQDDELVGEVRVLISDDFAHQSFKVHHELHDTRSGARYSLEFVTEAGVLLQTGDVVRVRGQHRPQQRFDVTETTVLALQGGTSGSGSGGKSSPSSTTGAHTVAIVLINLLDGQALMTPAAATQAMWGLSDSANDIYRTNSRGALTFLADANGDGQPDVFGPYNVPSSGAGRCDYSSWSTQAAQLATTDGVNVSLYDHVVYVLSNSNGCWWGGLAVLNGHEVWINYPSVFVFAHELGHNLGMNHAGNDPENDGVINYAYGDYSCLMGIAYQDVFLNAPHTEQLGFLTQTNGNIVELTPSTAVQSITLRPLDANPATVAGPRIVKLRKADTDEYYYLSFRDNTGYDANLNSIYHQGVSIHRYKGAAFLTAYIDTLADGEYFVDLVNGLTITQIAKAADQSAVALTILFEPTCGPKQPTVTVESSSGQAFHNNTVGPNERAHYRATLTNLDAAQCPASMFQFGITGLPTTITATFSQPTVSLAPGQSTAVLLDVDTYASADGASVFTVVVTDGDATEPYHTPARDYGRITVDSLSLPPEPPSGLSGYTYSSQGKLYAMLTWKASPSSGVALYRVFRQAVSWQAFVGSTSSTSLSIPLTENTVTFYVAAENAAGKLSVLSAPVTLTVSKGGK